MKEIENPKMLNDKPSYNLLVLFENYPQSSTKEIRTSLTKLNYLKHTTEF